MIARANALAVTLGECVVYVCLSDGLVVGGCVR